MSSHPTAPTAAALLKSNAPAEQGVQEALERVQSELLRVRSEAEMRWSARTLKAESALQQSEANVASLERQVASMQQQLAEQVRFANGLQAIAAAADMGAQAALDAALSDRDSLRSDLALLRSQLANLAQAEAELRHNHLKLLEGTSRELRERESAWKTREQELLSAHEGAQTSALLLRNELQASRDALEVARGRFEREQTSIREQAKAAEQAGRQQLASLTARHGVEMKELQARLSHAEQTLAAMREQARLDSATATAAQAELQRTRDEAARSADGLRSQISALAFELQTRSRLQLEAAEDLSRAERASAQRLQEAQRESGRHAARVVELEGMLLRLEADACKERDRHDQLISGLHDEYARSRAAAEASAAEARASLMARLHDLEAQHDQARRAWQEEERRLREEVQAAMGRQADAANTRAIEIAESRRQHAAELDRLEANLDARMAQTLRLHEADRQRWQAELESARRQHVVSQQLARTQSQDFLLRTQALEQEHAGERARLMIALQQASHLVDSLSARLESQFALLDRGPARWWGRKALQGFKALVTTVRDERRALVETTQPGWETAPLPRSVSALLSWEESTFLEHAYRVILHRDPDEGGLRHYAAKLAAGTPRLQVLADLRHSPEGRSKLPRLRGLDQVLHHFARSHWPLVGADHRRMLLAAIEPAHEHNPEGGDTRRRLEALGSVLSDLRQGTAKLAEAVPVAVALGRIAGPLGLDAWNSARDLVHANGAAFVRQAFALLFAREPKAHELERWVGQLEAGASRAHVIDTLVENRSSAAVSYELVQRTSTAPTLPETGIATIPLLGPPQGLLERVAETTGEWLLFVHPGVETEPGALGAMLATFEAFPGTGLVCGVLSSPDGTLLNTGARFSAKALADFHAAGEGHRHARTIDIVLEAAFLVPRFLFDSLGTSVAEAEKGAIGAAMALALRARGYRSILQPSARFRNTVHLPVPDAAWVDARRAEASPQVKPMPEPTVLAVFEEAPDPRRSLRDRSRINLLLGLRDLGCQVQLFVSLAPEVDESLRAMLEARGVAVPRKQGANAVAEELARPEAPPAALWLFGAQAIEQCARWTQDDGLPVLGVLACGERAPAEVHLRCLRAIMVERPGDHVEAFSNVPGLKAFTLPPMQDTSSEPTTRGDSMALWLAGPVADAGVLIQRFGEASSLREAQAAVLAGEDFHAAACALACGVPVLMPASLATKLGVRPGDEALIADNREQLTEALSSLALDRERWHRLSEGGHRFARDHYGPAAALRVLRAMMEQTGVPCPGTPFKPRFLPIGPHEAP